jgi:hypothetical protein
MHFFSRPCLNLVASEKKKMIALEAEKVHKYKNCIFPVRIPENNHNIGPQVLRGREPRTLLATSGTSTIASSWRTRRSVRRPFRPWRGSGPCATTCCPTSWSVFFLHAIFKSFPPHWGGFIFFCTLQLQIAITNYNYKLQLQIAITNCNYKLQLQIAITNCN